MLELHLKAAEVQDQLSIKSLVIADGFQSGLSEQSPDVQEELFPMDSALNSPLDT